MRARLVPLAVPIALVASLSLLGGVAHAEQLTVEDAVRDVTYGPNGGEDPQEPGSPVAPGTRGASGADVATATLVHGNERVTAAVRVRDLRIRGGLSPNAAVWMRTPDGRLFVVYRTANRMGETYSVVSRVRQGRFEEVCAAAGRRSEETDVIRYRFERDCLGDPEYLSFGAAVSTSSPDVDGLVVDDAQRIGDYDGGRPRIPAARVYAGRP